MESNFKSVNLKPILTILTIGIWTIVIQNTGLVPKIQIQPQKVQVISPVEVSGNVTIDNEVTVSGSVEVDNTVDVNIEEIIGHTPGGHTSYTKDGKEYMALDVTVR